MADSEVAYTILEAKHKWDDVREALEALQLYLEEHEPHAEASIAAVIETLEAIPN